MPEMILQGADGKPAIDAATGQPATMEELLRRRGILAYGGNSRMMPLGDPVNTPSASGAGAAVDPSQNTAPASSLIDEVANTVEALPDEQQIAQFEELEAEGATESNLDDLVALGLIPAALAAAYAMWRRRKGAGGASADGANTPNTAAAQTDGAGDPRFGTQVKPAFGSDGANPYASGVEDAEFYHVYPDQIEQQRLLSDQRKGPVGSSAADNRGGAIPPKAGAAGLIEDNSSPVTASRQQIGARQSVQSRTQPVGTDPIHLGDSYSDFSNEEMRHIRSLADQLYYERARGRKQKHNQESLRQRRAGPPTAPIERDGNGVLNEIVAALRNNKAARQQLGRGIKR